MFYCTRLYRFAKKGVSHCEVKGITREDGIGFPECWNVGKEVVLDMVSIAPCDKMFYAATRRPSGVLVVGMLAEPLHSAVVSSKSSSGLG